MFAITVSHGVQAWRLLYKTEEKADAIYRHLTGPIDKTTSFNGEIYKSAADDFGQCAAFKLDAITGVMLENLDESKLANVELGLHQQRTQVAFQQRAESDPAIRAASRRQGPAVIDPTGFNGTRFS